MITAKQAASAVKQKYPNRTVTNVFDYDSEHYVVEALENVNEVDYNAPFYGVEKSNGKVSCFSPGADLDKWFECLDRGPVG